MTSQNITPRWHGTDFTLFGEDLLSRPQCIFSIFPVERVIITTLGTHFQQKNVYYDQINLDRYNQHQPMMTDQERSDYDSRVVSCIKQKSLDNECEMVGIRHDGHPEMERLAIKFFQENFPELQIAYIGCYENSTQRCSQCDLRQFCQQEE